jgi:hypothetical protein
VHLTIFTPSSGVLIGRFRPALARLEGAFGQPLDPGEK